MNRKQFFAAVVMVLCTGIVSPATGAQWVKEAYLDIYGGQASYSDQTVTAKITFASWFGDSVESAKRETGFSDTGVGGVRMTWWLKEYPRYGLSLDLSHFTFEGEDVSGRVLPLSGMIFYRHPLLVSGDHEAGRLQPYLGFGLTLLLGDLQVDLRPDVSEKVSGGAGGTGVDARCGLRLFLGRKTSIFAEVRYLRSSFSKDEDQDTDPIFGIPIPQVLKEASAGVKTNQVLFGISTRLD